MKTKLNITIEEDLLKNAKRYAVRNETSLSQLIEHYLKSLILPARKNSIIQKVEALPKPKIDVNKNLKTAYHEEQKGKYGI